MRNWSKKLIITCLSNVFSSNIMGLRTKIYGASLAIIFSGIIYFQARRYYRSLILKRKQLAVEKAMRELELEKSKLEYSKSNFSVYLIAGCFGSFILISFPYYFKSLLRRWTLLSSCLYSLFWSNIIKTWQRQIYHLTRKEYIFRTGILTMMS